MEMLPGLTCEPELRTLHVSVTERPHGHTARFDTPRTNNTFVAVTDGEVTLREYGHDAVVLPAGALGCIPLGARNISSYTGYGNVALVIGFTICDADGAPLRLCDTVRMLTPSMSPELRRLFINLRESSAVMRPSGRLTQRAVFYAILAALCDLSVSHVSPRVERMLRPGLMLLEEQYARSLPVRAYADACGLSEGGFRRLFHTLHGMSPVEYRTRLRIAHAEGYLRNRLYSVSETARFVGFENVSYFSRVYRRFTGRRPGEYE
ncbi:MAG: helix-turn-helix transcriptional regulator [Clostridiales bacterium]|jgi:AraC-like DNA-binding protein|nr:helix-turn-helix transcriptional regulator [Clostridiales bacterium]